MMKFEGSFDVAKLQDCLRYVSDSLEWLAACSDVSQISVFPSDLLVQTMETCKTLVLHLAYLANARVSINRLPSEIFGHMLLFLKDQFTPFPNPAHYEHARSPPSVGLWHRPGLVCRRWRREVLGTPGLWTTIRISEDLNRWTSMWQLRSGALPLTVVFNNESFAFPLDSQVDVLRSLAETRQVQALCFYQGIDCKRLRPALKLVASQLETLFVTAEDQSWRDTLDPNELPCELPQLQVLSMARSHNLRGWSMGGLRHLSVGCEPWEWGIEELHGFLATLATNTRLEELMLCRVGVSSEVEHWESDIGIAFPEYHWPICMPNLKRLFIEEEEDDFIIHPMEGILNQALILSPTCTRFYVSGNVNIERDRGKTYPIERLVVMHGFVVGTDGISACVVENRLTSSAYIPPFSDCTKVQELWLQVASSWNKASDALRFGAKSILDLQNVVKLVIQPLRHLSSWLQAFEDSFPALKELHILAQYHDDRQAILQFLAQRKQSGLQLDALHFVGDPAADASEAFNSWKENSREFFCLVERVVFEEVRLPTDSPFKALVSARLGLPEACKHPSPTSLAWQPWDSYV